MDKTRQLVWGGGLLVSRKSGCNSVEAGSQGWYSVEESAEEEGAITKKRLYKVL